jgi:hypothetical protein
LTAAAFGQERRDPTIPSSAIQQRLHELKVDAKTETQLDMQVRAIVMKDANHGTALLKTPTGHTRITLNREQPTEFIVQETNCVVTDFDRHSITIRIGRSSSVAKYAVRSIQTND